MCSMNNDELIKQIKGFFEKELNSKNQELSTFSNEVTQLAYQKFIQSAQDMIQSEEDPIILSEILKNLLDVSKMIDEKGLQRQQVLLKLFEQLNKYEQSRYY